MTRRMGFADAPCLLTGETFWWFGRDHFDG
ncbi:MAG: hypothetical protein RIS24_541, partial [Verrucomicrobiota bacterium]